MNLQQIEAFLAVYEEESFSAGATRLKLSQPTASKLVDALERDLGYRLFQRNGARIAPTPEAQSLYVEMARVKRGFDHLLDRARDLREETTGRLVIGANPVLSADFMPRLIERFARAHPGVQIQLESDNGRNLIEAWLSGMIDIGFVTRSAGSRALAGASTLQANHLIDIGTVCALPAGHRLANAARIDLADLAGEPFVALTGDAGSRRELDAALARAGAPVRIVAEASTPLAAVALVARGLGVALVSDLAVFACAGRDRVVARPISPPIGSVIDYAVSDEKRQSPLVKAFLAMAHADAAGIHRDIVGDPFG